MFVSQILAAGLLSLPIASAAMIHDVFVGGSNGLKFTPESITASVGDSIRFTFGTKNHTVTQSTFASPCSHMSGGFFSGYMPVSPDQGPESFPQFWIPVKDTKPIWAFCSQGAHCSAGMVFAVNAPAAPAANSFDNYKAVAMGSSAAQATTGQATDAGAAYGSGGDSYGSGYGGGGGYGSYGSGDSGYGGGDASAAPVATSTSAAPLAGATDVGANAAAGAVPVVHKVTVGGSAGLVFTPSSIQAAPGDIVSFEFQVKNHTVTQSTFATPCSPMAGGWDSGYMPVAASDTTFPVWNMTVPDSKPIWAFCAQGAGAHCKAGMVFAVNAVETSDKSFAAYQALAKGSTPAAAASSNTGGTSGSGAYGSNGAMGRVDAKWATLGLAVVSAAVSVLL